MKTDCRFCEDANAYVMGELEPSELASFEAHLADCAECQAVVQSTRSLVSRLRSVPEIEPSRDFAALALAEGREEFRSAPGSSRWPRLAAIAALVAILAVTTAVLNSVRDEGKVRPKVADTEETVIGLIRARDWFVRNQEADGSWNAERWGGHKNYAPALTALPLLALTSGDGSKPEYEAAANRAVAWLLKQQNPDGTFGPAVQGGPYNQSIATLALLHVYQRSRDAVPRSALDSAVAVLTAAQMPEGGWGYRYTPLSDRSITQWHVQALELAASLDWKSAGANVERGLKWLSTHSKPLQDSAEPADSTSAILAQATARPSSSGDALDFYQSYFAVAALEQARDVSKKERLAAIHRELLRRQVAEGNEGGSWSPDDHWGRAGGRLYSTALASLSLRGR